MRARPPVFAPSHTGPGPLPVGVNFDRNLLRAVLPTGLGIQTRSPLGVL